LHCQHDLIITLPNVRGLVSNDALHHNNMKYQKPVYFNLSENFDTLFVSCIGTKYIKTHQCKRYIQYVNLVPLNEFQQCKAQVSVHMYVLTSMLVASYCHLLWVQQTFICGLKTSGTVLITMHLI